MLYLIVFLLLTLFLLTVYYIDNFFWVLTYFSINLPIFLFKGLSDSNFFHNNYFYPFSMDFLSFILIFLSILVVFISLLAGFSNVKYLTNLYFFLILGMMFSLIMFFSTSNFFIFFFFFEFTIMPMMLIISIWSSNKERLLSNYYFVLYTLISGLPFFVFILKLFGLGFIGFNLSEFFTVLDANFFIMFFVMLSFLCKMPIYSLHLWLPKAHVEAPVSSSMILAGLLLKLGGYSILRLFTLVIPITDFFFFIFLFVIMFSSFVSLIMCSLQVDIKSFVAYSSVSHMSLSVSSVLISGMLGFKGVIIMMVGHSLTSPLMFYLANLIYERVGTRMYFSFMSVQRMFKFFSVFFLLSLIFNMGFPLTLNFWSEVLIYIGLLFWSIYLFLFIFMIFLFTGIVMIQLYLYMFRSDSHNMFYSLYLTMREVVLSVFLIFMFILFSFYVFIF